LKNVLERARLFARGATLSVEHFSFPSPLSAVSSGNTLLTLNELEINHIRLVLERRKGDVSMAAKDLGISRATLYRKLKELP
jgi:transcriptional regulator of acetoin/glycerol metabolism